MMPRARDPNRDKAFEVYKKHKGARKVRNPRTGETFTKDAKDELGCKVMREGKNLFDK